MLEALKNLVLAVALIYGAAYAIGFIVALIKHRQLVASELVQSTKKVNNFDKIFVVVILLLVCIAFTGCSSTKHVPSWRDAYLNRKPIVVERGVPLYAEHAEYLSRNVGYMCLAGIKPMLPAEFSNKQATDFCACMIDSYYTSEQYDSMLLKLDYNPSKVVVAFKQIQDEYWAVLGDQHKANYREIVKYPPGYYEKITENRAKCIDDVNYTEYTKQVVTQD